VSVSHHQGSFGASSCRCRRASMRFRKSWPGSVSRSNWYSCP